jgi:hypothetical protein
VSATVGTIGHSAVDPRQQRYTAVWEKRSLIASLPETDIALDAGAANGEYVMHLLTRARRVVAVDLDPARVAQLRTRFAHVENVSVVQASVDALPFRDRAFGIVWASEIVEHLTSVEASLDEFERVSDAHLIATLPSPLGPYRYLDPTHRLRYSIGGLRRALMGRQRWDYRLEGLGGCLPQWLGLARLRSAWLGFSRTRPWAAWTLLVRGQRAPAGR